MTSNTEQEETQQQTESPDEEKLPVFRGTPEDWWAEAEEITVAEAEERVLGDWYISVLGNSTGAVPSFRVATPARPPNEARRKKMLEQTWNGAHISTKVRRLIKNTAPVPAWVTSDFVMADAEEGSSERCPWQRKNSGRWQRLSDGRITVNERTMQALNPRPATIS